LSEYQDKSSLNKLIGAPPGYSQAGEGGYFTEAVRKNPFSLVLLDEIEKAHPDILNIFLQVMDDGRLTDSSDKTIDFTNTIIIATSNAGTGFIQTMVKKQIPILEIKKQLTDEHLGKYFRPEFLNRFDGIIVFKPLNIADVESIAKLMLVKIKKSLEADKGIELKATPEAVIELANAGFDQQFGARPLRRVIQSRVQDPIANYILSNQLSRRDTIIIKSGGQIEIKKAKEI
jgi:ATP-dependent Clp protease ATP-binding subunit ClpA